MEWQLLDAQSLATIDREIDEALAFMSSDEDMLSNPRSANRHFSAAEYEVERRVIYATGDFEYKSLIEFSERSLQAAAAALASRSTIIVDQPTVKAAIAKQVQNHFANPVYCAIEAHTRPQKDKTAVAWGMESLAKRCPEGIFVVGQAITAFRTLINLIEAEKIRPVLVIATPPAFINIDAAKNSLKEHLIPSITINSPKGGAMVAGAILDGLLDLAWEAYG